MGIKGIKVSEFGGFLGEFTFRRFVLCMIERSAHFKLAATDDFGECSVFTFSIFCIAFFDCFQIGNAENHLSDRNLFAGINVISHDNLFFLKNKIAFNGRSIKPIRLERIGNLFNTFFIEPLNTEF